MPNTEDKRGVEGARASSTDDKLRSLRSYRQARGLCDKCAEKWVYGHKCAPTVQLHAMQELWDLFQSNEVVPLDQSLPEEEPTELQLAISLEAMSGPKSLKFQGLVQGHNVTILVDCSTHTFLSAELACKLQGQQDLTSPLRVQVANGEILHCTMQFHQIQWSIHGYLFTLDFKVLPLTSYDLVVGMDWLEAYNPMKVDWKNKWVAIPYAGGTTLLQGIMPGIPKL